ncbi:MAG: response regulator [Kineosporiaceae bacterium]|nr:response regulator [Kineosporiaceae bacterium]MBK7622240.1 response regulator [Kineosporiaceae bacterium]MBK8074568.1 response regulator [Kineosporiaceae bacterium]
MSGTELAVLVVEDEPVARRAHAVYVDRVDGFRAAASAATVREALQVLRATPVDLVLLDLHLPDGHGLDIVRALRAAGHRADVIAVTSARDLTVVRSATSLGVVQYILKPFTFATLRDRLADYRVYLDAVAGGSADTQEQIDRLLTRRRSRDEALPKGMSQEVLGRVCQVLRGRRGQGAGGGRSAGELAVDLGVSRVTARRYAEYLVEAGRVLRRQRPVRAGRPEVEYLWTD